MRIIRRGAVNENASALSGGFVGWAQTRNIPAEVFKLNGSTREALNGLGSDAGISIRARTMPAHGADPLLLRRAAHSATVIVLSANPSRRSPNASPETGAISLLAAHQLSRHSTVIFPATDGCSTPAASSPSRKCRALHQ